MHYVHAHPNTGDTIFIGLLIGVPLLIVLIVIVILIKYRHG